MLTITSISCLALWLALDFRVFVKRIEPVFLKPRVGSARCYNCHSLESNKAAFHLQPLGPDGHWSVEQSRLNFDNVQSLVVPGEPMKSRLLLHPLAAEAGGDPFHSGGKFWNSRNDPEWRMLSDWVRKGKRGSSGDKAEHASKSEARSKLH